MVTLCGCLRIDAQIKEKYKKKRKEKERHGEGKRRKKVKDEDRILRGSPLCFLPWKITDGFQLILISPFFFSSSSFQKINENKIIEEIELFYFSLNFSPILFILFRFFFLYILFLIISSKGFQFLYFFFPFLNKESQRRRLFLIASSLFEISPVQEALIMRILIQDAFYSSSSNPFKYFSNFIYIMPQPHILSIVNRRKRKKAQFFFFTFIIFFRFEFTLFS